MNNYESTIESFIDFCDDMKIAEEGIKDIFKREKKSVKISEIDSIGKKIVKDAVNKSKSEIMKVPKNDIDDPVEIKEFDFNIGDSKVYGFVVFGGINNDRGNADIIYDRVVSLNQFKNSTEYKSYFSTISGKIVDAIYKEVEKKFSSLYNKYDYDPQIEAIAINTKAINIEK